VRLQPALLPLQQHHALHRLGGHRQQRVRALGQCQHVALLTCSIVPSTAKEANWLNAFSLELNNSIATLNNSWVLARLCNSTSQTHPAAVSAGACMQPVVGFRCVVGSVHLDDEHLAVQRQPVVGQDAQQLPLRDGLEELGAACESSKGVSSAEQQTRMPVCIKCECTSCQTAMLLWSVAHPCWRGWCQSS
jgi:hypothetical protein